MDGLLLTNWMVNDVIVSPTRLSRPYALGSPLDGPMVARSVRYTVPTRFVMQVRDIPGEDMDSNQTC